MDDLILDKLKRNYTLKEKQKEVFDLVELGRKEILAVLPTGYGKSLIYQLLPFLLDGVVIVFSPLSAIQEEQLKELKNTELSSCILNTKGRVVTDLVDEENEILDLEASVPLESIQKSNLIFAHPEAFFKTDEGQNLLQSERFTSKVKAIVIDECHKVHDWGSNFRRAFQQLKDISAYFPDIPKIGLSATITIQDEKDVINALGMKNPAIVKESPDRPNIFLSKKMKDTSVDVYEGYSAIYEPLCDRLLEEGAAFPVTLVYIPLQYMGNAVAYCNYLFNHPCLDDCLFGALCSGQDQTVKRVILAELEKENPRVRLVFTTSILGMGFNSPSVVNVIHTKPPRNLADFVQEIGRAGRKGQKALSVLYYTNSEISSNIKDIKDDIVAYCRETSCLRAFILSKFGIMDGAFVDNCCSNCQT